MNQKLNQDNTLLATEAKCLDELKQFVKKNSQELDSFEWLLDDKFLLHFVRGKKFKPEKAATSLKHYFHIRRHKYKPLFLELTSYPESHAALQTGALSVLKHRDEHNRALILFKFTPCANDFTMDQLTKGLVLILEECWNCQHVETQGVQMIADLSDFGWNHFKMLTPQAVYKCVNIFWSNMPIRYKNVHVVNSGSLFDFLMKGIRPLLPSTLRDRLVIHSNNSELHKIFSPEILPAASLGGDLPQEVAYDTELIERIYAKGEYYQRFVQYL